MLSSSCDVSGQPTRLFLQIKKEFPETPIIPLQRRLFNEGKGLQRIQNLVADKFSSVVHTVTQKYYSLSSTAALLKYLELVRSVIFTPKSLKIEFQGSEKTVMIGKLLSFILFKCYSISGMHCYGLLITYLILCRRQRNSSALGASAEQPCS